MCMKEDIPSLKINKGDHYLCQTWSILHDLTHGSCYTKDPFVGYLELLCNL